jgi:lysophospholipase L1-like esterase
MRRGFVGVALAACALLAAGVLGAVGLAGAAGRAGPIEGTWRSGGHLLTITGSLEGGFAVTAAESWTINRICTIQQGTLIARYTPKGGSKYEVRWLNVWAPLNPDAPGAKCEFVFDGGPETVTIKAGASSLTISGCGNACSVIGSEKLERAGAAPPTTAPKPTSPKPEPPTPWKKLTLDYELPSRYGNDANDNGAFEFGEIYTYVKKGRPGTKYKSEQEINPKFWTVRFTVRWPRGSGATKDLCPAPSGAKRNLEAPDYSWQIGSAKRHPGYFKSLGGCVFEYTLFPKQQSFRVTVKAQVGSRVVAIGQLNLEIRDLFIAGLGDSNASGEGNPDVPGARVVWESAQCNRSNRSFQARTAARLELVSEKTSVTFVHLACSGASIEKGLIGDYAGIDPSRGGMLRGQVEELARLARGRPLDAVLVSIGVNDLRFGRVVTFCLEHVECFRKKGLPGARPGETVEQAVQRWLNALPGLYTKLEAEFERSKIVPSLVRPERIYITEYFDSLRGNDAKICDPLISLSPGSRLLAFDQEEAEWAYNEFLLPLNAAVRAAAEANGWTFVSGAQQLFRRHGYCSADSWIVPLTESTYNQRSLEGTLHANAEGHQIQSRILFAALAKSGLAVDPA